MNPRNEYVVNRVCSLLIVMSAAVFILLLTMEQLSPQPHVSYIYTYFFVVPLLILAAIVGSETDEVACLVARWRKTTGEPAGLFPRDSVECQSLKNYFLQSLEYQAKYVNTNFLVLDAGLENLENLLKERPVRTTQECHVPSDLTSVRERHEKELKTHLEVVWRVRNAITVQKSLACALQRRYKEWWNLARDLGRRYHVELMPATDAGAPFGDSENFRLYLAKKH